MQMNDAELGGGAGLRKEGDANLKLGRRALLLAVPAIATGGLMGTTRATDGRAHSIADNTKLVRF